MSANAVATMGAAFDLSLAHAKAQAMPPAGEDERARASAARSSRLLRSLAAAHNNLGAAHHGRVAVAAFDEAFVAATTTVTKNPTAKAAEAAFEHYQESVQIRMEAIQIDRTLRKGGVPDPSAVPVEEDVEARIDAVLKIEEGVRRTRSGAVTSPPRLDFFKTSECGGDTDGLFDAPFLPSGGPPRLLPVFSTDALDDNLSSAVTLCNLGTLHSEVGSADKSVQLLGMSTDVAPPDKPVAVDARLGLGRARLAGGDTDKAARVLSKAIDLQRAAAAANPYAAAADRDFKLAAANALSMMGRVRLSKGDAPGALDLLLEAASLRRSVPQADGGMAVAASEYNVGVALRAAGDLEGALERCGLFAEVALSRGTGRVGGAYAAHVASALQTAASIHLELGRPAEALQSALRALRLGLCIFGPGRLHASVAESHFLSGRALHELGRLPDALGQFESALRIERALAADDDVGNERVATVLCHAGQVHQALDDRAAAAACYEEVLRVARLLFGDGDPFVARMVGVLASVRSGGAGEQAQTAALLPYLKEALGIEFHPAAAAA